MTTSDMGQSAMGPGHQPRPGMKHRLTLLALVCMPTMLFAQRTTRTVTAAAPGEERFVDSVLALMTVEDKVGQLNQMSGPPGNPQQMELMRRGGIGVFLNVLGADATHKLQQVAVEETRLRIPVLFGFDVIHGYRTTFPVPLAEASSWDPATAE